MVSASTFPISIVISVPIPRKLSNGDGLSLRAAVNIVRALEFNAGASSTNFVKVSFILSKKSIKSRLGDSCPLNKDISISLINKLNPLYVCLCPSCLFDKLKYELIVDVDVIKIASPTATPSGAVSLLKLKVDTGLDQRTILSGISKYYSTEEILNKKVMVLINLKPRKMMGYESQGMLLLADDGDGNLSLMQPDSDISNGSVIA